MTRKIDFNMISVFIPLNDTFSVGITYKRISHHSYHYINISDCIETVKITLSIRNIPMGIVEGIGS